MNELSVDEEVLVSGGYEEGLPPGPGYTYCAGTGGYGAGIDCG